MNDVLFDRCAIEVISLLQRLYEYSANAEKRGLRVIIAGAGGAAHIPGSAHLSAD